VVCTQINTDEPGVLNVPTTYNVRSIPTLMLFKKGELVETLVGAVPKKLLTDKLQRALK
jgi:thioredoxin 1